MRAFTWLVCAPALVVAAACGRGNAADDALKNDLALASQAQAYNPNFNPNESGYAPQNAQQFASPNTPRAVQTVARQPVYRRPTSTARRSSFEQQRGILPGSVGAAGGRREAHAA